MELTNNETNVQTIVGGEQPFHDLLEKATQEGWSHRHLTEVLTDEYGVSISQFAVRSLLMKWKEYLQ